MWLTFFAACALILFFAFSTSLLLRGAGFSWTASIANAPVVSLFAFCLLAIVYQKIGIFCSWKTIFLPVAIISLLVFAASRFAHFHPKAKCNKAEIGLIALYAFVGLMVGLYVFVKPLDGPECFTQTYDDITHLALVRSFAETGNWSVLTATTSPEFSDYAAGGYYPAAFHLIAAMTVNAIGVSVPLATNATCYIISSLMFPLACLALLHALFPNNKMTIIVGSIACICSVSFPWYFLIYGKLSANLLGFALFPAIAACFISAFSKEQKGINIQYFALFVIGLFSCVFTQPNVVFTLMVFLLFFWLHKITHLPSEQYSKTRKSIFTCGLLAIFSAVWWAFLSLPFMQGTVSFVWPSVSSTSQALADVAFSGTPYIPNAIALSALASIGVFYAFKRRENLWLIGPCVLMAITYIVCASSDSCLKNILGGFWYTDQNRLTAMLTIFEIPLICLGASFLLNKIKKVALISADGTCARLSVGFSSLILLAVIFCPSFAFRGIGNVDTPFGSFRQNVNAIYSASSDSALLNKSEEAFVAKAAQITGYAKVINSPYDGSVYAYQAYGMHTYYRSAQPPQETDRSLIRLHLNEYESNENVKAAVDSLGAEYLILLEPQEETGALFPTYKESDWKGVDSVNDDTPGFEIVLAEGNMRLYKIVK